MFPFLTLLIIFLRFATISAQFDYRPQGVIIRSATERPDRPNFLNPRYPDIIQASYIRFMLYDNRTVDAADTFGVQYVDSKGYARNSTVST